MPDYRDTFVEFVKVKYGEKIDVSERIKPKEWWFCRRGDVLRGLLRGPIGRVFYRKIMRLRRFMRRVIL